MTDHATVVPAVLADRASRWHGRPGREWVDRLPALVARAASHWTLTPQADLAVGGDLALVVFVETADHEPAVLKMCPPGDGVRLEAAALRHWTGLGAVRLLAADTDHGTLLLERLEPGGALTGEPDATALPAACAVLRTLWRRPTGHHGFPTTGDRARTWSRRLPEQYRQLGQPFERPLLDAALEALTSLESAAAPPAVLLHGDFDRSNILAACRAPWLAIDPNPVVGDPEFDAADLLADFLDSHVGTPQGPAWLNDLLTILTGELGLDRERLRRWLLAKRLILALDNIAEIGDGDWDLAFARHVFHDT